MEGEKVAQPTTTGTPDVLERTVEVEGKHYLLKTRFEKGVKQASFDDGKTWRENVPDAFRSAKAAGTLAWATVGDVETSAGHELASVTVELLGQIRALRPGERLEVVHTGTVIQIMRHRSVLEFRPSALEEAGIEPAHEED